MTRTPKSGEQASREDRLSAALRANLARRKAQARARAATADQPDIGTPDDNPPESEE